MQISFKTGIKTMAAALLCAAALSCTSRQGYVAFRGYAQGGTYTVKANLDGVREEPDAIAAEIDSILARIDASLSGYNKGSLLSRFNRGETIVPDEIFLDMYERAYALYEESEGVVDAAGGPLFDIWGFGFKEGEMPSDETVAQTRAVSGMSRLRRDIRACLRPDGSLCPRDILLQPSEAPLANVANNANHANQTNNSSHHAALSRSATALQPTTGLPNSGTSPGTSAPTFPALNYNAIAQGYSCDLVARYLHSLGIHDMLVDIGEIWCEGHNPNGKPWSIGIDRPEDGNNTPGANMQQDIWHSTPAAGGQGVVTSGNYRKFYIRDGRKYSHTIDPRTGYPVSHNLLSATIVAPDATTADAVATWCMVIGLDESEALLRRLGLDGYLIYAAEDGTFKHYSTAGFLADEE